MVERNPGIALDLGWVESSKVNLPAIERRTATHKTRRSIKKEWQAAWLLRAVTCIDLTTLDGDDTPSKVITVRANYNYILVNVNQNNYINDNQNIWVLPKFNQVNVHTAT